MAAAHGATGDIKNNLMKLLREVQRMKLRLEPDVQGLCLGAPSSLLPILHYSLMHYSLRLASWLSKHDYGLYGKNDLRFVEGVYKVLREVFHYHPRLTKEQFLTVGYAERKLQLVTDFLLACQEKHHSLVGTQLTRRAGRNRQDSDRTNFKSAATSQDFKSEVLTVQSTSGISSAWTEPVVTRVQGPEDEDSSPDHTPSPPPLTPTRELELTPSLTPSPPPLPSHSSPNSHKPVVIRHGIASMEGELEESNLQLSVLTIPESAPRENLVIENISSSSEGGGTKEGKLEPPEGPPRREGDLGELKLPFPQLDTRTMPQVDHVSLVEVNGRVQQLAKMVERMSARFVLIETQLKAIRGAKLTSEQTAHHKNPTEGRESHSHDHTSSQEEEEEEEEEEEQDCAISRDDPLVTAGPVSMATETSSRATNPAISKATVSKPTCTYNTAASTSQYRPAATSSAPHVTPQTSLPHRAAFTSQYRPATTSSAPDVTSQTSLPHTAAFTSQYRPAANKAIGRSGTALSSQLARIRAEPQLPLPLSPHLHTPPHSIVHTPKASDLSLGPSSHSPLSPNDTTQMLASLRDRAKKTRDFLQRANTRPGTAAI